MLGVARSGIGYLATAALGGAPRRVGSPSTVPSGRVTLMNRPPLLPSRNGLNISVTLSPALILVDFQPCRLRLLGLFSSMLHKSVPPESLDVVNSMKECGLVH